MAESAVKHFDANGGVVHHTDAAVDQLMIGHAVALCLSRAIARSIIEATPAEGDILPTWRANMADAVALSH